MEYWTSLRTRTATVQTSFSDSLVVLHRELPVESTKFTVFRDFFSAGRKYTGRAEVLVTTPCNGVPTQRQLEEASIATENVADPWYPVKLLQHPSLPSKTSTFSKQELEDWVHPIQEVLSAACAGEAYQLLSEHVLLSREECRFRDSSGRDMSDVRYRGYLEVSLLPVDQPESHPVQGELHFSEFSPSLFRSFMGEQGRLTLGSSLAQVWVPPKQEFLVLLRGSAVRLIFNYLLRQLCGSALYKGDSQLVRGEPLWAVQSHADQVTMSALPLLYDSPCTSLFDDEGVVLKKHNLVTEGTVEGFLADQRTSHWLGLPLTGINQNFSVSPGSADFQQVAGSTVLEVHSLRMADIEDSTGDFVAVVELADFHSTQSKLPVTGFSLRGNLRTVLSEARFSSDIGSWENFEGPEFLLVPSPLVLGG